MKRADRLSLAWSNLTQDWKRLGLYVAGITIAVLLVFVQLGFRNALLASNALLLDHLSADLLLISSTRKSIAVRDTFSRRRLIQAAWVRGVRSGRTSAPSSRPTTGRRSCSNGTVTAARTRRVGAR